MTQRNKLLKVVGKFKGETRIRICKVSCRYPPVYQGPKKRQNFDFLGRISIQGPRNYSVTCLHPPKNTHRHPEKS